MKHLARNTILSLLGTFVIATLGSTASGQSMFGKVNDFDGDGRGDLVVTRLSEDGLKVWHIWQTTAGYSQVQWGLGNDWTAAGDYDGDGKTDIAVARNTVPGQTFSTYILQSTSNSVAIKSVTNVSAAFIGPQDYDGDGKTDPTVTQLNGGINPVVYLSSATGTQTVFIMPSVPVRIGDLSGDGSAEVTSYGSSAFSIKNPNSGVFYSVSWGLNNDRPAAGDFDGDGIGDLAIFRESTGDWWCLRSSDSAISVVRWGSPGDIIVPADYDGDGKTDQAVYRRGEPNGIYYINASANGFQALPWGTLTDTVVAY